MSELYDVGYRLALPQPPWQAEPPGFGAFRPPAAAPAGGARMNAPP
jgi:hypothetical protein